MQLESILVWEHIGFDRKYPYCVFKYNKAVS